MTHKEQLENTLPHVYGHCPRCKAAGAMREKSPKGNTTCRGGHSYPHADSVTCVDSGCDLKARLLRNVDEALEILRGHDDSTVVSLADEIGTVLTSLRILSR